MDGNRRFAKRLMLKPWKGHEWGAKKIEAVLNWCEPHGIRELTLYAFSIENFNRPKMEFEYLMNLFKQEFDRLVDDKRIFEKRIRINVIGRTWMFPEDVQERMKRIMDKTKDHDNYVVNFAMAYGGRAEVIDAVKKVANEIKDGETSVDDINEESFSKYLYMADEPELIIRTGGEKRLSNFLLWQSSYAELYVTPTPWPEFSRENLETAISAYQSRERRFGKTEAAA